MSEETSEEKKHPPSLIKLDQLRRKGQVATSRDFVNGVSTAIVAVVAFFLAGSFFASFSLAYDAALAAPEGDFPTRLANAFAGSRRAFVDTVFTIGAVSVGAVLLADIFDKGGIVISGKAASIDFNRLNPVKGIQKLFKLRTGVELLKTLTKAVLISAACAVVLANTSNDILWAPSCGEVCVAGVTQFVLIAILVLGLLILILVGAIDLKISRAVFRHEQRMTETERKREMKDQFGAPEIRQARQQTRRALAEAVAAKVPHGDDALTMIVLGRGVAVAVYYDVQVVEVPIVVAKADGTAVSDLVARGSRAGAAIHPDALMARGLFDEGEIRELIPERFYDPVAMALAQHGRLG